MKEYLKKTSNQRLLDKSKFPNEIKEKLTEKVEIHNGCEYDDLELDSFVVSSYGKGSYSLECELYRTVIISNTRLEKMLEE